MPRRPDRGMVTAELAVVLPAVVLLLAVLLGGIGVAIGQVRCVDAARLGARAAARGDPAAHVESLVREAAPRGATVQVRRGGDRVVVLVRSGPGVLGSLLPEALRPEAAATTPVEKSGPPR